MSEIIVKCSLGFTTVEVEFARAQQFILSSSTDPFGKSDTEEILLKGIKFAEGFDFKTFGKPNLGGSFPETMTLDDARMILGACIRMLGGSISFTRAELIAVNSQVPTIEVAADGTSIIARMPL